jgi:hypothetical protein
VAASAADCVYVGVVAAPKARAKPFNLSLLVPGARARCISRRGQVTTYEANVARAADDLDFAAIFEELSVDTNVSYTSHALRLFQPSNWVAFSIWVDAVEDRPAVRALAKAQAPKRRTENHNRAATPCAIA